MSSPGLDYIPEAEGRVSVCNICLSGPQNILKTDDIARTAQVMLLQTLQSSDDDSSLFA